MSSTVDPQAKYTTTHEWVRLEDGLAVVGITDYAQHQLSDLVYVELPAVGAAITRGAAFSVFESVKAAEDIIAPISGTVQEVNDELAEHPEWVNSDPYGKGWLARVTIANPEEVNGLMDATAYSALLAETEH